MSKIKLKRFTKVGQMVFESDFKCSFKIRSILLVLLFFNLFMTFIISCSVNGPFMYSFEFSLC